jgi:hypothetical protein
MRIPLLATLCGLAAAAALLAWRGCDEQRQAPYAPVAGVPAGTQQSAAPLPAPASAVAAAPMKPVPPEAARPPLSVFALSSDHQTMIKQTVFAKADHKQLEHEPRDDAWATESERAIRQELAQYPSASDFDVIAIDCRQTLCAVQAFSYSKNAREWVNAMDDLLFTKTLEGEFDMVNTAFPTEGSRTAVLTFFHRRTAKPQR